MLEGRTMRNNMRAERVRNSLTAAEAAESIGVNVNALLRWETGEAEPLAGNLLKLAKLYGCSPEYLLEQTSDRHGKAVAV